MNDERPSSSLRELALLFLKLGTTAFGGPAAHIALMQEEFVERRQWMTREHFLDLISAANVVPGPNSTEVAMHVGFVRGRWWGLLIAGACFILPAAFIVAVLAMLYVRFGRLPAIESVLYGVKPVVLAIVLQAIWRLGKTALKTPVLLALCAAAVAAALLGVDELLLLVIGGVVMAALAAGTRQRAMLAVVPPAGLLPLFLFFLKIGSILFGSGYVLLAFLRSDLVLRYHWITDQQLLDAIAVGQVTPGPVFTTATFIGYVVDGGWGAVLATIGIFLPSFIFVAVSGPLVTRVRRSRVLGAALDGINAASLALMIAVEWQLARAAMVDALTIAIAVISAIVLLRTRWHPTWLIAGSAAAGWIHFLVTR